MRLSPAEVRLLVDSEVAAGEGARALRQAFDRDRNGVLDPGEQQALTENLFRSAILRTQLLVDGAPVALRRDSARAEKVDEPATSTSLLALRAELSAPWPPRKKNNFFFALLGGTGREVELRDEDESGHVPVSVECLACSVTRASSGVPDGNRVRGAGTPLRLTVKF